MVYRNPTILQEPDVYRPVVPITRRRATRPSGDHEVIDPQPVHRYQAQHPETKLPPVPFGWRLRRVAYRNRFALVVVLVGSAAAPFAIDWFTGLPDGTQRNALVGLVIAPFVCAVTIACLRRLR